MIYKEKPQKIAAVGHLNEDGVDLSMTCSLQYSNNRTATVTTSGIAELPCSKFHVRSNENETGDGVVEFPQEESDVSYYPNSMGLRYEATDWKMYKIFIIIEIALKNGSTESSVMPLKDSELLAEMMDEIRRQLGVVYPEDLD
ncbi:trans-1,2-dihydrobenzene-1,2-diol dehydrogenase [Caerostris extrusa]|uniref:Trans-1,2-dihydrobenzene-1,2-diol dehydrogenase n=1 Tax=Caerostris extrusa TaxID=172846 RepID=A0AAV4VEP2_CAEEX|nr:trans-1,2-dihydrobenzene-1,2-diol dehydrogenase [Caerostris extrusa]